ncbi:hypothetical protein ACN47E_001776 [Coniothyrium glycines]
MKTVAALSAVLALANAHATWQQLWKNGEDLESTCARLPPSNSPIEDYTGTALQCNVNPAAASGKCSFAPGDVVTMEMHQHNTRACTEEGIGGAHWGPVLAYLSKVEDAATADGSSEFFKVYENTWKKASGSTQGDNDHWGTKDLNYNCGKLDFTIPENLAPGDYLLRAEAIALHAASSSGGAQHYVTCYQLTVSGSGTLVPKDTVTFPSAYTKTGPGLGFSIHTNMDSYPAPGPALIEGGTEATPQLLTFGSIAGTPAATGGASPPAASSSKAAEATSAAVASSSAVVEAEASSVAPVVTSAAVISSAAAEPTEAAPTEAAPIESAPIPTPELSAAPEVPVPTSAIPTIAPYPVNNATSQVLTNTGVPSKPSPAVPSTFSTLVRPQPTGGASGAIKEYYQCGGQDFKGTGSCAEGLICKEWNPYYSQCIKGDSSAPQPAVSKEAKPTSAVAQAPKPSATKPAATKPADSYPANPKPTATAPAATRPAASAPAQAKPTQSIPAEGSGEKTYTLETFIAFLEQEAGSDSAAKIRRMIEALQM